ncbi:PD-(D/E)XK nuclease family protein [Dyadobacter subterraneus]|uniref:PD-(D/E)XK nuclease family protein n=1 Tax=Dyadobacter subterraneus TaxID=2773304 RepID=A0ABR9WBI0_9BACT|nr:PD-(D/E)XK nuclease family protein [Dyadobacter subterraneus]MBE9462331.1 PD-(D/E)XK nuclease family protein [Dyadobacter subterraneus]
MSLLKPNIFSHATKELSQDAFFAWLLEWADSSNQQFDNELNEVAKDFVRLLLNKKEDYVIHNVVVRKQWQNIDISAEVNDEYCIVIEDKTNTKEHSGQLKRYADIAKLYYKETNFECVFIYLKTGNESSSTLQYVKKQDFIPLDRSSILKALSRNGVNVKNSIFTDFVEYLVLLEYSTNSFKTLKHITADWKAAEGFYMSLESEISNAGWGYVSNQSGGFLALWFQGIKTRDCNIYIQIENTVNKTLNIEDRIRVVLKISEWEKSVSKLYSTFEELKIIGQVKGIDLVKPNKFRVGSASTLAVTQNVFSKNEDEFFKVDDFVNTLKRLEETLQVFLNKHPPDVQDEMKNIIE